jgi:hypothetical protein
MLPEVLVHQIDDKNSGLRTKWRRFMSDCESLHPAETKLRVARFVANHAGRFVPETQLPSSLHFGHRYERRQCAKPFQRLY